MSAALLYELKLSLISSGLFFFFKRCYNEWFFLGGLFGQATVLEYLTVDKEEQPDIVARKNSLARPYMQDDTRQGKVRPLM